MARMSSVIYVMHKRVSATGEQASARLDVLSLNSMETHYVSPTCVRSSQEYSRESKRRRKRKRKKKKERKVGRFKKTKSNSGNSETIKWLSRVGQSPRRMAEKVREQRKRSIQFDWLPAINIRRRIPQTEKNSCRRRAFHETFTNKFSSFRFVQSKLSLLRFFSLIRNFVLLLSFLVMRTIIKMLI